MLDTANPRTSPKATCENLSEALLAFTVTEDASGESVRLAPSGTAPVAAVTLRPQRDARAAARRSG
jgi:hypothetical protein